MYIYQNIMVWEFIWWKLLLQLYLLAFDSRMRLIFTLLYFLSAHTVVDRYLNHTTALPLHMHLYDNENDDVHSVVSKIA